MKNFKATNIALIFFFYYVAQATWFPFFNTYLEEIGLSGTQLGIIGGIHQSMIFFVVPLWGYLADRIGVKKIAVISISSFIVLLYNYQFIADFEFLLIYTFFFAIITQPLGALMDTLAINYVRHNPKISFGELRVWGSIGWMISTFIIGKILYSAEVKSIFIIAPIVLILLLIFVLLHEEQNKKSSLTKPSFKQLVKLFSSKSIIGFYLILFFYGILISPLSIFLNLYFADIGATTEEIGLAFAIQPITEIPLFFLAAKLIRRFSSTKLIIFTMICAALRMVLYGIIKEPQIAIWIGLLNGITLSLFLVAVVDFLQQIVPEKLRATGQSLFWAAHFGAGVTLGNILIGYFYENFGMQIFMLYDSAFVLVLTIFSAYFFYKIEQPKNISTKS